ncbi:putative defense protein [Schistocerca nitens]|uniref:putative defense protein n=1 Tax=Schistocerca nitens TaxID=7011 RepID=UPI00211906BF|nr:putative defense protein [Schistocerca nitens]
MEARCKKVDSAMKWDERMQLLVLFCVALLAPLAAGAPPSDRNHVPPIACEDMAPIHGDNQPSEEPAPYTISVSTTAVTAGQTVTVHFSGNTTFRGVYVQARQGDQPVGQFLASDVAGVALDDCAPGTSNALEYVSSEDTEELDVEWVAPDINDVIVFRASFVKTFPEFWVGVESETVTVGTVKKASSIIAA